MSWLRLLLLGWNIMMKATWGGKGLFHSLFHTIIEHWKQLDQELKLGRNLEAGADAEAMEGCCLFNCLSGLLQPAFLHHRTTCQGNPLLAVGLALPHQPLIKKMPHRIAYRPLWDNYLKHLMRKLHLFYISFEELPCCFACGSTNLHSCLECTQLSFVRQLTVSPEDHDNQWHCIEFSIVMGYLTRL